MAHFFLLLIATFKILAKKMKLIKEKDDKKIV